MNSDPIVITGVGFHIPLGESPDALIEAFRARRTAIRPLTRGDWSTMPVSRGGELDIANLARLGFDPLKLKGFKPYIHFGLAATKRALEAAGLPKGARPYADDRIGAYVSTGINGENAEGLFEGFSKSVGADGNFDLSRFAAAGIDLVHPKWILTALSNNLIFFVTSEFALRGDNNNVTYSAIGGCHMLDAALTAIRTGACDAAVVTGTDSPLNWQVADDLAKAGVSTLNNPGCDDLDDGGAAVARAPVPDMACYTDQAIGTLPGEGAASFVLERRGAAAARKAPILAEVLAVDEWSENREESGPDPSGEGVDRVLRSILPSLPEKPGHLLVVLDGCSARAWDDAEWAGVVPHAERLAKAGWRIRFTANKPWFGHTFSAAFVVDSAIAALALERDLDLTVPHAIPNAGAHRFFHTPAPKRWDACLVLGRCLFGNTAGALFGHA